MDSTPRRTEKDPRDPETRVWALEAEIAALVAPDKQAAVKQLLDAIGDVYEDKALDWEEGVWRAVARWLILDGRPKLWRRMFRALHARHTMYSGDLDAPSAPWHIAYGPEWWQGHPELVRLKERDRRRAEQCAQEAAAAAPPVRTVAEAAQQDAQQ